MAINDSFIVNLSFPNLNFRRFFFKLVKPVIQIHLSLLFISNVIHRKTQFFYPNFCKIKLTESSWEIQNMLLLPY